MRSETLRNHSELGKNFPFIRLTIVERKYWRAVVRNIAYRKLQ